VYMHDFFPSLLPLRALSIASFLQQRDDSAAATASGNMENKREGMRGVGRFPLAAAASASSGEERKEIPAAAAEPGQLPHEIWGCGYLQIP
jgi:hypothetical protein